jgi:hypothetical protein
MTSTLNLHISSQWALLVVILMKPIVYINRISIRDPYFGLILHKNICFLEIIIDNRNIFLVLRKSKVKLKF